MSNSPQAQRALASMAYVVERSTFAMQAAWLEWKHGRGADAAMQWIENTLDGPDLIPDTDVTGTDAQAFFDQAIADLDARHRQIDIDLAALVAGEADGG